MYTKKFFKFWYFVVVFHLVATCWKKPPINMLLPDSFVVPESSCSEYIFSKTLLNLVEESLLLCGGAVLGGEARPLTCVPFCCDGALCRALLVALRVMELLIVLLCLLILNVFRLLASCLWRRWPLGSRSGAAALVSVDPVLSFTSLVSPSSVAPSAPASVKGK